MTEEDRTPRIISRVTVNTVMFVHSLNITGAVDPMQPRIVVYGGSSVDDDGETVSHIRIVAVPNYVAASAAKMNYPMFYDEEVVEQEDLTDIDMLLAGRIVSVTYHEEGIVEIHTAEIPDITDMIIEDFETQSKLKERMVAEDDE